VNCETAVFFLTDYSVGVVKSMKVLCLWSVKHYLVNRVSGLQLIVINLVGAGSPLELKAIDCGSSD